MKKFALTLLLLSGVAQAYVPPLPPSKTYYVDKARTDIYTQNGSILQPFKTIQGAVNKAEATGTCLDATPCAISIGAGAYAENVVVNDPTITNLSFIGQGFWSTQITPISGLSLYVTAASFSTSTITGIFFGSLEFDTGASIELHEDFVAGDLSYGGTNNCALSCDVNDTQVDGNFNASHTGFLQFMGGEGIYGEISITNTSSVVFGDMTFHGDTILIDATSFLTFRPAVYVGGLAITNSGFFSTTMDYLNSATTVHNLSGSTYYDVASIAKSTAFTNDGGSTILTIGADRFPYVATTPGNWSPVPLTAGAALDELAGLTQMLGTSCTLPDLTTAQSCLNNSGGSTVGIYTSSQLLSVNSGGISLETGNTVDGNSGQITILAGVPSGSGVQGNVSITGNNILLNSNGVTTSTGPLGWNGNGALTGAPVFSVQGLFPVAALAAPTVMAVGKSTAGTQGETVLTAWSSVFSCSSNPVVTIQNCGSSTTCASPTTLASVMVTASGQFFNTSAGANLGANNFYRMIVSGTCASLQLMATAEMAVE